MSVQAAVLARLPATAAELAADLGRSVPTMRHTLAAMYFEGRVGCNGSTYFPADYRSNGTPVVRHLDGRDVVA